MTKKKDLKVKILICCHKETPVLRSEVFTPIHVGKKISSQNLNMIGDDSGDNISEKNTFYAELTALYWAWKNYEKLGNPDYIGLFHYRRFLNFRERVEGRDQWEWPFFDFSEQTIKKFGWEDDNIREICTNTDFIASDHEQILDPVDWVGFTYLEDHYKKCHVPEDFDKTMNIIKKLYPDFDKIVDDTRKSDFGYFCNMFILKKEHFFEYMEWLFNVLFELESQTDFSKEQYTKPNCYQRRTFGFLGERLLNFYIEYKKNNSNFIVKEYQRLIGYLTEKEQQEYQNRNMQKI